MLAPQLWERAAVATRKGRSERDLDCNLRENLDIFGAII